ncbi:MAG TPA: hypothetical protein VGN56_01695 [Candidatus Paceibacterota bacterium]|jgi:hypothetical protein|nr:hypothetical protein [Candidatus Paceibacterota bacterium]
MRLLLVLCAFACYGTSALAQEATDAQRLNAAAFARRPYIDTLHAAPQVFGQVKIGRFAIEPSYTLERTAESWRVPESGQDVTTSQVEMKAYLADHPIMKLGVTALMRSGRHNEPDPRDPSAYAAHFGHDPNETKVMVDLIWLLGLKK